MSSLSIVARGLRAGPRARRADPGAATSRSSLRLRLRRRRSVSSGRTAPGATSAAACSTNSCGFSGSVPASSGRRAAGVHLVDRVQHALASLEAHETEVAAEQDLSRVLQRLERVLLPRRHGLVAFDRARSAVFGQRRFDCDRIAELERLESPPAARPRRAGRRPAPTRHDQSGRCAGVDGRVIGPAERRQQRRLLLELRAQLARDVLLASCLRRGRSDWTACAASPCAPRRAADATIRCASARLRSIS